MLLPHMNQTPPAMTLEGVLGPNSRLDEAHARKVTDPDALAISMDGHLLFSAGNKIYRLANWDAEPALWGTFDHGVTALAVSESGNVAIAMTGGLLAVRDAAGKPLDGWPVQTGAKGITDCLFLSEEEVAVVDTGYAPDRNLLSEAPWEEEARGQVIAVTQSGATRLLAGELRCPAGITFGPDGNPVLTLLDEASIVDFSRDAVQSGFPAYLGRLSKTSAGYVMACLARRDPLIEFLKTEREFVAEMKSSIAPRHWISPRGNPEFSHDFPIELGATRLYGEVKPWAPSFSYGLVIELDKNFLPVASAHSRANGSRHQITDALQWGDNFVAVSRASGEILRFAPEGAD